jgi:general secretion pathway protein C
MALDRWVRYVAAAALPMLGVAAWMLRTDPPPAKAPSSAVTAAPPERTSEPGANQVALVGEKALARRTDEKPAPPERLAATLPPAETPRPPLPPVPGPSRAARGCGGLEARVISVGDDPEWTFASIAPGPGEPARLHRVGDRVGAYRIAAIEWDRVWVQAGGPRCAIELHAAMARDAGSDRPPPWLVPEAIAQAIEKRSETEYRVHQSAVPEIFEQGGTLLSGVRLHPVNEPERDFAIELEHVPMDSLLERLGVQSGDVLESLNGVRCNNLTTTLAALAKARENDKLLARLTRAGEKFEIEIRVENQRL